VGNLGRKWAPYLGPHASATGAYILKKDLQLRRNKVDEGNMKNTISWNLGLPGDFAWFNVV